MQQQKVRRFRAPFFLPFPFMENTTQGYEMTERTENWFRLFSYYSVILFFLTLIATATYASELHLLILVMLAFFICVIPFWTLHRLGKKINREEARTYDDPPFWLWLNHYATLGIALLSLYSSLRSILSDT